MTNHMTKQRWQVLYEAVLAETDLSEVSAKLDLALAAIHQRVDDVSSDGHAGDEQPAILEALRDLQRVLEKKNEHLGAA